MLSKQELTKLFDKTKQDFLEFEETDLSFNEEEYQRIANEIFTNFSKVESGIRSLSLFSKNEDRDDLQTEDLKFLTIHFYLGLSRQKIKSNNRMQLVKDSIDDFNRFLNVCKRYKLLDNDSMSMLNEFDDRNSTSAATSGIGDSARKKSVDPYEARTKKVEMFKKRQKLEQFEKDLFSKIEKSKKSGIETEELERDYYFALVHRLFMDCFEHLQHSKEELSLLEYAEKNIDDEKLKDIRKMKDHQSGSNASGFVQVPLKTQQQALYGRQQLDNQPVKVGNSGLLTTTSSSVVVEPPLMSSSSNIGSSRMLLTPTNYDVRQKILSEVFIDRNPPTKSLEQFAKEEMERMKIQQDAEKNTLDSKKTLLANSKNEDLLKQLDEKTKKDREWDDWKDDHPKGMGNMKRN